MSITAVPSSIRLVRAPAAASSGNGEASCWAKWCTRKYAPSAPASSAATASSIDCSRASAPERTMRVRGCRPVPEGQEPNLLHVSTNSVPSSGIPCLPSQLPGAGSVLTVTAPAGRWKPPWPTRSSDVRTRATDRLAYAHDASHFVLTPQAVVVPRDAAEVGRLFAARPAHRACR